MYNFTTKLIWSGLFYIVILIEVEQKKNCIDDFFNLMHKPSVK